MYLAFSRRLGAVIASCLVILSLAVAQEDEGAQNPDVTEIDLGERDSGDSYDLNLGAKNENCDQLVDFKFSSDKDWIKFPSGPFVRQVTAGQTRMIDAKLDFSSLPPGDYIAIVDVDCENCGVLVFKNCKIDKQQLQLKVRVVASVAQLQALNQKNAVRESRVDAKDKRIPRRLRNDARKKHADWSKAVVASNDCVDELAALQTAATKASDEARAAKQIADTAEQDLAEAQARRTAEKNERESAIKAVNHAMAALREAKKNLEPFESGVIVPEDKEAAERAVAEATTALEAAEKRKEAAQHKNKTNLFTKTDITRMQTEAARKRKAADKAATKAAKANKPLQKKRAECLTKTAFTEAETVAIGAIPPPPPGVTADDVAKQNERVKECAIKLGNLMEAQRQAIRALGELGALGDGHQQDIEEWADAVKDSSDLFGRVPSQTPLVGAWADAASTALTIVGGVLDFSKGLSGLSGKTNYVPVQGGPARDEEGLLEMLETNGFATSPEQARLVYEQMKLYTKATPDSTELMQKQLEYQREQCKRQEDELTRLENELKNKETK